MAISTTLPVTPLTSWICALSRVMPDGRAISEPKTGTLQYWIVLFTGSPMRSRTNLKLPSSSNVHATLLLGCTSKRQPRSAIALSVAADCANDNDGTAGTPPIGACPSGPTSHTAGLPLPSVRLAMICGAARPLAHANVPIVPH